MPSGLWKQKKAIESVEKDAKRKTESQYFADLDKEQLQPRYLQPRPIAIRDMSLANWTLLLGTSGGRSVLLHHLPPRTFSAPYS